MKMAYREERKGLLEGIQILDLADEKASFCSKLLADMGARVIKIERPGGDPSRKIGPFLGDFPHPERSLSFYYHNTNKLGITLNLEHPAGRDLFLKLVNGPDIVVESFPQGHLKKLYLDFETLREVNPKTILVSVTGFGQKGPRSQYRSSDLIASAYGGQMFVSGDPTSPPLKPFGEQSYYTASLFAAIAILLALRKRTHNGRGDHIDISLQEAVTSTLEHVMIRFFYEGIVSRRQGKLQWNNLFHILPCQDGHILLTLFHQWETLVEWMESEGMAEDLTEEKYRDEEYRLRHLDHVIEVLEQWTKTHTKDELFETGQLMAFPWSPIHSPKEVLDSPQLRERDFFREVAHPELNTFIKYPGSPFKRTDSSIDRCKRAPLIGEDNVQIYQKELGLSGEEMERLRSIHAI
jgi:crotonobetainyl-CoA:carnitine CoA-transferase CaiB-like acyl-CoA transferase